jgi:DNA-binding CsgD family transcriptional regulator
MERPSIVQMLYSSAGLTLWSSAAVPPYKLNELKGQFAWAYLLEPDSIRCQAAFLRCIASGESQTFDCEAAKVGRWRVTFAKAGVGRVAVVGLCRPVPFGIEHLTDRQRQVCHLLATRASSKQIAMRLKLSRGTIDTYRHTAAKRLGIASAHLLPWCVENREWL